MDAYQMATDRICELLEKGIKPWALPWTNVMNCAWKGSDGTAYSLLNQMLLIDPEAENWLEDIKGEWLTFNEAHARGGSVKAGEHGRKVIFAKWMHTPTGTYNDQGDEIIKEYPVYKVYTVFKLSQCENVKQKYHTDEKTYSFTDDHTAESVADAYISREGITYKQFEGNRAYYSPVTDTVVTPLKKQFASQPEYYSTLFHELTHSTGHTKRLDRLSENAAFGSETYSKEELIAEIGSASILATLCIDTDASVMNSTAYIKGWLKALKNDKRLIMSAAPKAEKAVRMILGLCDKNIDSATA